MSQLVVDSNTVSDPSRESQLLETLKQYWGYDSFRPRQLDAINAVMDNRDSIVIFPTGGGKSLCFQVPAILRQGVAIVVSPLLSLMKDQVDALQANGVAAACLNSTLTTAQERLVLEEIARRFVLRDRRSPLRKPMGPRLPSRIPPARDSETTLPRCVGTRLYRDGHATSP